MNGTGPGTRSRVLVAVGPASPGASALTAAAQLAWSADAKFPLSALFVEDVNLLRLAELPFAFEVGAASATARRLVVAEVERALKRQADELRRALEEVARAADLDWTFEMARGRLARVLLDAAAEGDLVVLAGAAVRALDHAPLSGVVRNALHAAVRGSRPRSARPVAVALRPGRAARRVLSVARRLAQSDAELTLLIAERDADNRELAATIEAWTEEHGANTRVVILRDLTPADVAKVMAEKYFDALFWPGDHSAETAPAIEALIDAIDCPVIVVR